MNPQTSVFRKCLFALSGVVIAYVVAHLAGVSQSHLLPLGLIGIAGMSWQADEPTVKLLASLGLVDATTGMLTMKRLNILAKTADYTVLGTEPCGTLFTTRGAAGAVNFTLPTAAGALKGMWYEFLNLVDQNMTITAVPADTLITDGDLAADSIAVSTASHKIGGRVRVLCDGTSWIASGENVGATYTIAT